MWDSAGNTGGEPIATTTDAGTQIINFTRDNTTKTIYATVRKTVYFPFSL